MKRSPQIERVTTATNNYTEKQNDEITDGHKWRIRQLIRIETLRIVGAIIGIVMVVTKLMAMVGR